MKTENTEFYIVTFTPMANNPRQACFVPGVLRLKRLLKIAARVCNLRAVDVREVHDQADKAADPQASSREAA